MVATFSDDPVRAETLWPFEAAATVVAPSVCTVVLPYAPTVVDAGVAAVALPILALVAAPNAPTVVLPAALDVVDAAAPAGVAEHLVAAVVPVAP
jgi:hypothetical protein